MDWPSMTHGKSGMLLVLLTIFLPLSFALVQFRAPLRAWLASPLALIALTLLLAFVFSLLLPVLRGITGRSDPDDPVLTQVAIGITLVTGYIAGVILSRFHDADR